MKSVITHRENERILTALHGKTITTYNFLFQKDMILKKLEVMNPEEKCKTLEAVCLKLKVIAPTLQVLKDYEAELHKIQPYPKPAVAFSRPEEHKRRLDEAKRRRAMLLATGTPAHPKRMRELIIPASQITPPSSAPVSHPSKDPVPPKLRISRKKVVIDLTADEPAPPSFEPPPFEPPAPPAPEPAPPAPEPAPEPAPVKKVRKPRAPKV